MFHSSRRRLGGAGIVSDLVAVTSATAVSVCVCVCGPAVAGAHGRARAAAAPSCRAQQLVNWLDTDADGTADTIFFQLKFTNLGRTCTLRGYPGVSAVSLSGHQLGNAARRVKGLKIRTLTLHQGRTISAAVGIGEVGAIPVWTCHAAPAAGLRVFAPNASAATVIPFPFSACSGKGVTSLTIRPVM